MTKDKTKVPLANQPLTAQQERFCQEYIIDLNATQAAIRAEYEPKAAAQQASRLLRNVKVKAKISELAKARSERTLITADVILQELLLIARADISAAFDEDGALKEMNKIPEDVRRSISGVDVQELLVEGMKIGYTKKIKFWDKPRALELLGKHLKLFTDKIEHSGKITLADLVAGSQEDDKPKGE